jgi:hypothetical protein
VPHDIFISHSSQDRAVARRICRVLEETGVTCWIAPRDIRAGQSWAAAIDEAIRGCRAVLVVVSASSNRSSHVGRELAIAGENRLPMVPVRIQDTAPGPEMSYWLAGAQWLDAFPGPIEAHATRITNNVRGLLGLEPAPPVSALRLWLGANRPKIAAGVTLAAAIAVWAVAPWPCRHDYRVRVALFDSNARPVEDATIESNATAEFRKVGGAWQLDIPKASKPADGRLLLSAVSADGKLKGGAELRLGSACAATVSIPLRRGPDTTVRGTVFDPDGRPVAGARVSVANHESELKVTGSDGRFELQAHEPAGSIVVLHVEKDGFGAIDQRHFAGPDPAEITLR